MTFDPDSPYPRSSAERTVVGNVDSPVDSEHVKRRASYQVYDRRASHIQWPGRKSSTNDGSQRRRSSIIVPHSPETGRKKFWKFTLREWDDEDDQVRMLYAAQSPSTILLTVHVALVVCIYRDTTSLRHAWPARQRLFHRCFGDLLAYVSRRRGRQVWCSTMSVGRSFSWHGNGRRDIC